MNFIARSKFGLYRFAQVPVGLFSAFHLRAMSSSGVLQSAASPVLWSSAASESRR